MSRMTEQIGRVLGGRYRLLAPIGRGASAQVFAADDVRLNRRVAVKVLHDALADDQEFLRRFRTEAQAAAALNHRHLVAVYDWGQDGDEIPWIVTEYLGGGSLRALLDRGHRLTPSQALVVGREAAQGLDYAHTRGFVHRDVKPANLLFTDEGELRIADFGLARALAEAAWTEPQGAVVGTARYASPEQAQGMPLTGRADVYSLALVLVEAVTGEVPFATDTTLGTLMARIGKPLPTPEALGPLAPVVAAAGDPDPDARLDARRFSAGLTRVASSLPRPAPLPLAGATDVDLGDDRDPTLFAGSRDAAGRGDGAGSGAAGQATTDDVGPIGAPTATWAPPEDGWAPGASGEGGEVDPGWPPAGVGGAAGIAGAAGAGVGVGGAQAGGAVRVGPAAWSDGSDPATATEGADPAPGAERSREGATATEPDADLDVPAFVRGGVAPAGDGGAVGSEAEGPSGAGAADPTVVAPFPSGPTPTPGGPAPTGPSAATAVTAVTAVPPVVGPPAPFDDATDDGDHDGALADEWDPRSPTGRRRRRWPIRLLVVLLVAGLGAAVALLVADITEATPTHRVPPVTGLTEEEAVSTLRQLGWEVEVERERRDGTEAGEVLGTRPARGTEVEEGREVVLLVSEGQTLVDLPEITRGMPATEAEDLLTFSALVPVPTARFDEEVPADHVVELTSDLPAQVEKGTEVAYVVSRGPEPRTVPDGLVGMAEDDAASALSAVGLVPGIERQHHDTVEAGIVISATPASGEQAPRDSEVVLVVSLGPEMVRVPDVSGAESLSDAVRLLEDAGLVAGDVQGPAAGRPAGTDPAAGTEVRKGSEVDIILRRRGPGGDD